MGESLAGILVGDFSRTGAYIVAATSLFVALILATQFSFSSVLHAVGGRFIGRLQALRTAWAHHREARRKERMRREVIRKHTQPRQESAEAGIGLPRIRRVKATPAPEPSGEAADDLSPPESGDLLDLPLNAPAVRSPAQKALPFVTPDSETSDDDGAPSEPRKPTTRRRRRTRGADKLPDVTPDTVLPPVTILDEPRGNTGVDNDRLFERGRVLQAKCGEFGVLGAVKEIHPGPVVTTSEF